MQKNFFFFGFFFSFFAFSELPILLFLFFAVLRYQKTQLLLQIKLRHQKKEEMNSIISILPPIEVSPITYVVFLPDASAHGTLGKEAAWLLDPS